ncbi:PmoA family protein [Sphingobacterium sp. SYP-B4668]|uniref:DUF6807 domain-containing protein n=1 Tax=Sphingobacterium sp. SYP-B4668 TaxID=2996035 RepID=UPI0022DD909E|nr:PmoA family protein [Sphingobacterium sp. SYP-B4668]
MKKIIVSTLLLGVIVHSVLAQKKQHIAVQHDKARKEVVVKVNNEPFTALIYPDSLEKPTLYPILAANGEIITRGFPLVPRPNEPTDHPHHIGLWMNYESVNGLDFWNNSSAIPQDKKNKYGWIKKTAISEVKSGNAGVIKYVADWSDIHQHTLLKEHTTFIFTATEGYRTIDRTTTLTAAQHVSFKDVKDGFLGLRVARELELPSKEERKYTDTQGVVTSVEGNATDIVTGNYLTSENKEGDHVWGTRGKWCMLYGKKGGDTISIVIIDHPSNVGYPTYWHARGYGLFAANPLGQKIFSNGTEALNLALETGKSATFRYRVVIASGKERLSTEEINRLSAEFADSSK